MARRASQTFDGYFRGILQRPAPRGRDPGYLKQALNVTVRGGAIQGRPGLRPFSGVACNGNIRGHGWHVKEDGTRELLIATSAGLQKCIFLGDPEDLTLDYLPLNDQVRVDVQRVYFLSLSGGPNTTFIYDGVNANLKWDGKVLTKMGVPDGPMPADPVQDTGDVDPGNYKWVETLVSGSSGHEGEISAVYREITTSVKRSFTFDPPVQTPGSPNPANNEFDDPQVTKWRLYRTVKDGAAYLFIGEADINTPIIDNVTNDELRGSDPAEEEHNSAPVAPITAMCEHRGQLLAVMADDKSVVRISNADPDYMVPEGWPPFYVQPVAVGDGDKITALRSLGEWCLIFKQNSSYALIGDSFEDYKIVPMVAGGTRQGVGTSCPGAVFQADNSVFSAGRDGFYKTKREGGLTARRISAAIDDLYSIVNFSLTGSAFYDRKRRILAWLAHG